MDQKSLEFIKKAKEKHNSHCSYDKTRYVDAHTKVVITCPIHGDFEQLPRKHLKTKNGGCPKCSRSSANNYRKISIDEFKSRANIIHGNKYDYGGVEFNKVTDYVIVKCPDHGEFRQLVSSHLQGHGCPICAKRGIEYSNKLKYDTGWFIEKANKVHNNKYDYNHMIYRNSESKVRIVCPKHGPFMQTARDHLNGYGCNKCASEKLSFDNRMDIDEFISKANRVHNCRYDYFKVDLVNNNSKIIIICPIHGDFEQSPKHHLRGQGCPKCNISSSHLLVSTLFDGFDFVVNDRDAISPLEIDIYVPDLKFGVEVHGNYWHSYSRNETRDEIYKHHRKYELSTNAGIKLYQFYEFEIVNQFDIVKSMINHRLGRSIRINARDTVFRKVEVSEYVRFSDDNHIQGNRPGICYGLYYDDILVCAASFARYDNGYELIRACNKLGHSVVGGFSKLVNNWAKIYNPCSLMTYADRRFSDAGAYKSIGFKYDSSTKPGYRWVNGINAYSRHNFQKHKLVDKLEVFDSGLSEAENMFNNGYRRLWDAGHHKLYKYF